MVVGTNLPPTIQSSVKFGDSALVFNKSRSNKLGTLLRFEGVLFSRVDGFSLGGPSQRLKQPWKSLKKYTRLTSRGFKAGQPG